MVIDFSKIDLRKRPTFILRNLNGDAIGVLHNILNPTGSFNYNDLSEIQFDYPSQIDGEKLKEYDLLTGMRVVDVQGYGQFILQNPEENDNGIIKKKSCKAYSLEQELSDKEINLEEGTYCFWNPFTPDSSILSIIIETVPSWTIGTVSNDLIGKYRTFSVNGKGIYDWMRSDLQEKYECIFDFDTYERKINVRSVKDIISTKPVYLSTNNLIKEIDIKENTDDLITALDVYGADGVDIRSVNPMGTNRIYNLDEYMNTEYFSEDIVVKWNLWKDTFKSYQQPYYQLVIAQNMQISRYTTEETALAELNGELKGLEAQQSTIHQMLAVDNSVRSQLSKINNDISAKKSEIARQENLLRTIQSQIDGYTTNLKDINKKTSFSAFFSDEELKILNRYFKCGSFTDSSFVATSTNTYAVDTQTVKGLSAIFNLTNLVSMTKTPYGNDVTFYIVRGGSVVVSASNAALDAQIVSGTLQVNKDNSFVFSLYLNKGTFNRNEFPSGSIAMTGILNTSVASGSTSLQFKTTSATLCLTQDVTEYQKMSIEWELFEYGVEMLEQMASPTYTFETSVANFLALDDYIAFAKEFSLGEQVYLKTNKGVLTPIVLGINVNFDDMSDFEITFSNTFKSDDPFFTFKDLVKKSTSMSKTLDFSQYNYSNFVNSGAKTQVKDFMTSAIDAMKNAIMAGENNELTIDQTGMRMRKFNPATGDYSPKQVWMAHNAIMFTNDNWNSATIGIGEFVDKNLGSIFGIVAPAIVGTILAGSSIVIESEKQDGGVAVFKVDAEGASLHNASFNLYGSTGGRIDLGAIYGIVAGTNKNTLFYYDNKGQPSGVRTTGNRSITKISDLISGDEPNASFWLDMSGNAYLKGKIIATSGEIGGFTIASSYLYSGSGSTRVAINGGTSYYSEYAFWAGNSNPAYAPFWVKKNGDMKATRGEFTGTLNAPNLKGVMTADSSGGWIEGCGIRVGRNYGANMGYNFYVDQNGNVWMNGSLTLKDGSIKWSNLDQSTKNTINGAYDKANDALDAACDAYDAAYDAEKLAKRIANGEFRNGTFINGTEIYSPTIYADEFVVMPQNNYANRWTGGYSMYGYFGNTLYKMLNIGYADTGFSPEIEFWSPCGAYAYWGFNRTTFHGYCDFSGATVTGLTATFA